MPYGTLQSITLVITIFAGLLMENSMGQLSFRMDPYRNTFTIQTPSLQQTFTRYYGHSNQPAAGSVGVGASGTSAVGEVGEIGAFDNAGIDSGFLTGRIQQDQQKQPHINNQLFYSQFNQQPSSFMAQNQLLPQRNDQFQQHQAAEQYILQRQQQLQQQLQQQQQQQHQNQQITRLSPEDLAAYFQQVQRAQQLSASTASNSVQQQLGQQQQTSANLNSAAAENAQHTDSLIGVAFSPSTKVSQVKFTNGAGVKYNF